MKRDMRTLELRLGRLLALGMLVSVFFVIVGGILYLSSHAHDPIDFARFRGESLELKTLKGIFGGLGHLRASGIIQFGILLLVLTQLLRVAFTAWIFLKLKERFFLWTSLFILALLIYSLMQMQ